MNVGSRERSCEGLSKERHLTLGLRARQEEKTLVGLGNKEWRSTKTATTIWGVNLMVETFYVIDGQQMLAIHREGKKKKVRSKKMAA